MNNLCVNFWLLAYRDSHLLRSSNFGLPTHFSLLPFSFYLLLGFGLPTSNFKLRTSNSLRTFSFLLAPFTFFWTSDFGLPTHFSLLPFSFYLLLGFGLRTSPALLPRSFYLFPQANAFLSFSSAIAMFCLVVPIFNLK